MNKENCEIHKNFPQVWIFFMFIVPTNGCQIIHITNPVDDLNTEFLKINSDLPATAHIHTYHGPIMGLFRVS